jgi:hypothetical protein
MSDPRFILATALLAALAVVQPAYATQDTPKAIEKADMSGVHDFDFLVGSWRVHHRRLKERLLDNHEWVEFEGTCTMRKLLDGAGNVDDNMLAIPSGTYRGVGLRSYDPKTAQWSIWWLDGRNPAGDLDPPVRGRFENGVGSFYSDDMLRGKKIKVRYRWSEITPTSAHWDQAYSPDDGKTWETNWTMVFARES